MTNSQLMVIATKQGRLGNRLMLSANFIGASIEYGVPLINPAFSEYAELYQGSNDTLLCSYPNKYLDPADNLCRTFLNMFTSSIKLEEAFGEEGKILQSCLARGDIAGVNSITSKGFRELLASFSALLVAHLNAGNNFGQPIKVIKDTLTNQYSCDIGETLKRDNADKILLYDGWAFRGNVPEGNICVRYRKEILKYFSPVERISKRVEDYISQFRSKHQILVGVHIRRTDYATWEGGKWYYSVEQYAEVMRRTLSLFPGKRVHFIICSDEKLDPSLFSDLSFSFGPGDVVEDLYSLASCDYIMGPTSTFTMWASFHGAAPLYVIEDINARPSIEKMTIIYTENSKEETERRYIAQLAL